MRASLFYNSFSLSGLLALIMVVWVLLSEPLLEQAMILQAGTISLEIRSVLMNEKCEIHPGFESGAKLLPKYEADGLPDCFLVKDSPDISIEGDDIKGIEIAEAPFNYTGHPIYIVQIEVNKSVIDPLRDYSKAKVGDRIALFIKGKLLVIVSVLDPIEEVITFTIGDTSLSELEKELSKISRSVEIK